MPLQACDVSVKALLKLATILRKFCKKGVED